MRLAWSSTSLQNDAGVTGVSSCTNLNASLTKRAKYLQKYFFSTGSLRAQ